MHPSKLRLDIFEESKQELRKSFERRWQTNDLQTFQFLSANLCKCLPALAVTQHKDTYFDILSYRVLQHIDTQFSAQFSGIDDFAEFDYTAIKKHLPALFVSYHSGSYRSAIAFLVKYNIDVVLIADPLAYKHNADKMTDQFQLVKNTFNSSSDLVLYPADQADLTVQIMGKMRKGYSVLAYVDGNAGTNGYYNRDNSLKIPFFGQEIFVRTGLATLSFYLKAPMIPMLSFYDENLKPRWNIYDPILPVKGEKDPGAYITNSTRYLYGILEKALEKHYVQWEGWLFLHRYLDIERFNGLNSDTTAAPDVSAIMINDNIGLFVLDNKYYALNKDNYKLLELTEDVFHLFDKGNMDAIGERPASDIHLLYKNGFLKERIYAA